MTATFSFTREPLDTGRGFPAFVPSDEERGQEEWAQFLRSGNWIEHDWTSYYRLMTGEPVKARPFVSHLCHFAADTIHRHGGLALEYGAAENAAVPALLPIVALGLSMLLYALSMMEAYELLVYNEEYTGKLSTRLLKRLRGIGRRHLP